MGSRLQVMRVSLKDGAFDTTSMARSSNKHAQIEIIADFPFLHEIRIWLPPSNYPNTSGKVSRCVSDPIGQQMDFRV